MKIRFQSPTEAFPFFHGVRVETSTGWRKVIGHNESTGMSGSALFHSQEEMIRKVKAVARGA